MNSKWLEQAKELASHPYTTKIERDVLSDGTSIYLASNPELEGCKSQGKTVEEALNNLADARIDYIYSLLEDGLSVPVPDTENTSTGNIQEAVANYTKEYGMGDPNDFENILVSVIQPDNRVPVYEVSVKT